MKRYITKIVSTATALVLALCICVAMPCASAFAAQEVTEKTDSQIIKADKDDWGDILDSFDSDMVKNLLKIDWWVFFDKEYDWDSLFDGSKSFGEMIETKEWDALVKTVTEFLGCTVLTETQKNQLEKIAENKFYYTSIQNIIEQLCKAADGDYTQFFDIINCDYSGLLGLSDRNLTSIIRSLLSSDDLLGDCLNGDYSVFGNIIGGDYSYITDLLNGDYGWIKNLIDGENVDFEALFSALDKEEIKDLISQAITVDDKNVLEFTEEYYDQIKALLGEDYSFITEIKDGKYDHLLELIKKLSELVGFEYNEELGDVLGQLTALDDKGINNLVRTFEIMLYEALPEEYQQIMKGTEEIQIKLDELTSDIGDLKDIIIGIIGDLDNDNKVSMTDVVLAQRNIANIHVLEDTQLKAADVDGDGNVTMNDVVMMQRIAAKI